MQRSCTQCRHLFEITQDDLELLKRVSPVIAGQTFLLPPPTHCPDCRNMRRAAFRNDQHYYKNTCHLCKKSLISIYSPDKNIPVLCYECFWSDRFDPLQYGKPYDSKRSFIEQYAEMRKSVPRLAIFNTQSENCEFTVHSSRNRNSYMCSSIGDSENLYYSDWGIHCRDSMDLLMCTNMELCYDCLDSRDCYNCDKVEFSTSLSDCLYCFDCKGCNNCIGCASIRNRKHWILNKESTREKYDETMEKLRNDSAFRKEFVKKFTDLKLTIPKEFAWNVNTENSTGNYIANSRNARSAFHALEVEDGAFLWDVNKIKDCMDLTRVWEGELLYECKAIVDLKNSCFCNLTYQCHHMLYCDNCHGSNDSFGCMSLKKRKYCILNTQFSKEEYEELVPKIIEQMMTDREWGEFFPVPLSAFGYNETKANEWYPLKKDDVLKRGWKWSDYEPPAPQNVKTIPANKLPPNIKDVPDDIIHWAVTCEITGKPFKIIPQELEFYRRKGLPIPHRSPHQRHLDRLTHENPFRLYKRNCVKCQKQIETTYAPDRPEIVYCERCYLETVY